MPIRIIEETVEERKRRLEKKKHEIPISKLREWV